MADDDAREAARLGRVVVEAVGEDGEDGGCALAELGGGYGDGYSGGYSAGYGDGYGGDGYGGRFGSGRGAEPGERRRRMNFGIPA